MALALLPQEVLSVVCRWLGLTFNEEHSDEDDNTEIRYANSDFCALRSTCKVIYLKTMHDAGIRIGCQLEELEVDMSERSLCNLLNLTTNPTFRDKIRSLSFGKWNTIGKEQIEEGEQINHQESIDAYLCSPELVHLLAECFRRLKKARRLVDVLISSNPGHSPILRALHVANFPEKMVAISVNPKRWAEQGYGALSASPAGYSPYIRMLKSSVAAFRERLVENVPGYHVQSFTQDYPAFTQFVKDLPEIEGLHLVGCQSHPRLRFCNACCDLFATNFRGVVFSHLTRLVIQDMYISGRSLRAFIKLQSSTLIEVIFGFSTLTDGSWRSIFQGLSKLPRLGNLRLLPRLCQKQKVLQQDPLPQNLCYSRRVHFDQQGKDAVDIKQCLLTLVRYFHTRRYFRISCARGRGHAVYQEVCLFKPRNFPARTIYLLAEKEMNRYAEAVL